MSAVDIITSIDIGSSQIRVVVAETSSDGSGQILGIGTAISRGIKKGMIVQIDQVVSSIREAIDNAADMVGMSLSEVYLGINGSYISLMDSHGVRDISEDRREITASDVESVLDAARVVQLPPERFILDIIPKQFIIDGSDEIVDPHGMMGMRLEVDASLITASKAILQNLVHCVERADLIVKGTVFLPLAEGELCLSESERNSGVVLIDLGGGTSTVSIFENGYLAFTDILPLGGEYITNDIAIGLRIKTELAESVKLKYGIASREYASDKDSFSLRPLGSYKDIDITPNELSHIIEPRVEEIFQLIKERIKSLGFSTDPPGGYVLTGGCASLSYIDHMAKKQLGSMIRIAIPTDVGLREPSYIGSISIIHWLRRYAILPVTAASAKKNRAKNDLINSPLQRVRNWLSEFI